LVFLLSEQKLLLDCCQHEQIYRITIRSALSMFYLICSFVLSHFIPCLTFARTRIPSLSRNLFQFAIRNVKMFFIFTLRSNRLTTKRECVSRINFFWVALHHKQHFWVSIVHVGLKWQFIWWKQKLMKLNIRGQFINRRWSY
jgi:hypothetical protein